MKDTMDRLLKNYSNARQSWDSWYFMNTTGPMNLKLGCDDYNGSPKQKVDENVLLSYLRYLALKDYHIEMAKVIKKSSNTKDNIFLILKKYSTHRPDLKKQIDEHLKILDALKLDIKKIIDLRDKFYAHLDADCLNYGGQGGLDHYNNIFIAVENAIITLTSKMAFQTLCDKIPSRFYHL